jgi:hypothetical protein
MIVGSNADAAISVSVVASSELPVALSFATLLSAGRPSMKAAATKAEAARLSSNTPAIQRVEDELFAGCSVPFFLDELISVELNKKSRC